jgi:hypothetical protein
MNQQRGRTTLVIRVRPLLLASLQRGLIIQITSLMIFYNGGRRNDDGMERVGGGGGVAAA